MKIIDKLYQFVVFIQLVFLFVFLLENYNNLTKITYSLEGMGSVFSKTEIIINYYSVIGILAVLVVLVILLGIQIAGSGISESGSKIFTKYIFLFTFYIMLSSASVYYLIILGFVGGVIQFMITIVWVLHAIVFFQTVSDND